MTLAPWHEENWRLLIERRARGSLPHALLVCGPEGLGKREFVAAFAAGGDTGLLSSLPNHFPAEANRPESMPLDSFDVRAGAGPVLELADATM